MINLTNDQEQEWTKEMEIAWLTSRLESLTEAYRNGAGNWSEVRRIQAELDEANGDTVEEEEEFYNPADGVPSNWFGMN